MPSPPPHNVGRPDVRSSAPLPPPPQILTPMMNHPRRPPAHRSVSLLHHNRVRAPPQVKDKSESSSDSAVQNAKKDSPSSLHPLGHQSSGESSNAEKWFEKSNNEIRGTSASFADNDPPFFMQNSSSSDTPPEARLQLAQLLRAKDGSSSLPLRPGLLHLGTDASSTEDFRSVIDDLTVENKKLRRRLKKFEKLHDAHLKDEKLFEVRIHGLPQEKKRELEDMLRKFTASLGPTGFPANGYDGLVPFLATHKTSSSQTSLQNTDSAYASMSTSGQGSAIPPTVSEAKSKRAQVAASRHQNIHSYLHQIPEGLMPQSNPATMTERAKKKLVVRRLEQIFAGKGAVGGHQHPLQQQELSNIAARADQVASEALGHRFREGSRVASFMQSENHDPTHPSNDNQEAEGSPHGYITTSRAQRSTPLDAGVIEQRPTRPLDLDLHRAQIPAENIEYIRHLGFSPPEAGKRPEEGHGWIYLNFLINMAQLHTINVTAEFVRKAVTEYSTKFEVSQDGRKLRWKASPFKSNNGTSSSGGDSSLSKVDVDTPDGQSPRKRLKTGHGGASGSGGSGPPGLRHADSRMVYTPLFFHKDSDEAEDSSSDEDDSDLSPYPAPAAGDSSGMTSSGIRTTSTKKQKKREDGPIIFYNNARFCTDLSGERKPVGNSDAPPYVLASQYPIGRPHHVAAYMTSERRGPLDGADTLPEPMELRDNPIPERMEVAFPTRSPQSINTHHEIHPVALEATGIGGVRPADNFAIAVQCRFALSDEDDEPTLDPNNLKTLIPSRLTTLLDSYNTHKRKIPTYETEILAIRKKDLIPSPLPIPLSFMPFDDDDDNLSDVSSSFGQDAMSEYPESPGAMPPSTAPQPVDLNYLFGSSDGDDHSEHSSSASSSAADDDDDGEVDFLAPAREVDPEAIRAREREYDANMAERLAEEIPAGSSAATAGGGSGFASPASGATREEYRRALKDARRKGPQAASAVAASASAASASAGAGSAGKVGAAGRGRAATADSMAVQGLRGPNSDLEEDGSVESEDDDDDEVMSDVRS